MSTQAVQPAASPSVELTTTAQRPRRWRDPWRKPRFLAAVTWGYLAWSILPVIIAVVYSFNAGRSRSTWQGFSMRWWWGDPTDSLFHDPALRTAIVQSFRLSSLTMLIAVPLGLLFAIGLDRWRGRPASGANFVMLLSFVMPEIILGVSMFYLFSYLYKFVPLGTPGQILALVTFQVSYPVIVIRARLLSIPPDYEEAAMDLGCTPTKAIRRVLMPLLYPAIFASAALVFADTIDDFVTVNYLSSGLATQPLSVKIYSAARSAPTPAVNAAATFMLISTLLAITVGVVLYRMFTKGQREGSSVQGFVGIDI